MSASDKQRKVRRLIAIVGGGISGLFAALQAYDNDCDVVILEESTSIGGTVAQHTSLQVVTDSTAFLKENPNLDASLEYTELPKLLEKYNFNLNDDSKFQSTPSTGAIVKTMKDNTAIGTALLDALSNHIPTLASFRFRIIRNAHATHLLLNKDKDTAVGVHYEVSFDQKSKSTVDMFCDAVILATGATHPNIAQVSLTSTKGLYAIGSLLSSASLLSTLVTALSAAKAAATFTGHRSQYGVVCQPDFVDSNGVLHETGIHPHTWTSLKLREKFQNNKTTFTFRFDLPSPTSHLGLLAGQYIALRASLSGQEVVRYYSPITRSSDYGKVELLVKIEPEKMRETSMTNYLYAMNVGDEIEMKGPLGGFEYHRNMYREIGLVAGGTGISPMMQIIRSVTAHPEDKTKIKLLYGNYVEDDILCKEELFYISSTRDNVESFVTLCTPLPRWSLGIGFINENMMKEHLPAPANDIKIVLCGPPGMIKAIIPVLKGLGYSDDMLFSYV